MEKEQNVHNSIDKSDLKTEPKNKKKTLIVHFNWYFNGRIEMIKQTTKYHLKLSSIIKQS